MRSKIVMSLFALVLFSVCGAFAAVPELGAAPAVDHPMPVEDFVAALGSADPSEPVDKVVISCSATCTSSLQCLSKCGPAFCGGTCRVVSACGSRKVCDCLHCP